MSDIAHPFPQISLSLESSKKLNSYVKPSYAPLSNISFDSIKSAFGIVLHMHQPTIPASSDDLGNAQLISNLEHMMEHQDIGDNHNAPVFLQCYSRMSDIVRELVSQGKNPRIMLDYSGNLLWGLEQMKDQLALDNLRLIATDTTYQINVEWLGTMWSHAVVSSTPIPDIKLHIMAWRVHFASIFGQDAVKRVKGFSPPEMHLPIHPDVCFEYIKMLKECGYEWLLVQEHTIENLDATPITYPHLPHRLVAKNSKGESEEITIFIKTQGSDTKLVAQMQPYYEAKTLKRVDYTGHSIPPLVVQVGDGENGGVMMNEFPPAYRQAYTEVGREATVAMNCSEYLEFLESCGVRTDEFIRVQPISQQRIWQVVKDNYHPEASNDAIKKIKEEDSNYNLDKASWTSDRSWVEGYKDVLDPMNKLSASFHRKFDESSFDVTGNKYRDALLHLLLSQTSCFRYWGEGIWTEYAKEIIHRGLRAIENA